MSTKIDFNLNKEGEFSSIKRQHDGRRVVGRGFHLQRLQLAACEIALLEKLQIRLGHDAQKRHGIPRPTICKERWHSSRAINRLLVT